MNEHEDYRTANRRRWNEMTPIHARSAFYNLDGFKAGELTLKSIEREELGDVRGKSLLHLQCHFGLDTLSWARLGAIVTGVDFSDRAIAFAQSLSREVDLQARFICADLYDLPAVLSEKFDIVFTSYGILCWLPDLTRWATVVAHFVRDEGTFYIVEEHPMGNIFDDTEVTIRVDPAYPYFHSAEPYKSTTQGTYADRSAQVTNNDSYQWQHSLGDILTAVTNAGLRVEFLHEFPYCNYGKFPFMQRSQDGWWRPQDSRLALPWLFSLKAAKKRQ